MKATYILEGENVRIRLHFHHSKAENKNLSYKFFLTYLKVNDYETDNFTKLYRMHSFHLMLKLMLRFFQNKILMT